MLQKPKESKVRVSALTRCTNRVERTNGLRHQDDGQQPPSMGRDERRWPLLGRSWRCIKQASRSVQPMSRGMRLGTHHVAAGKGGKGVDAVRPFLQVASPPACLQVQMRMASVAPPRILLRWTCACMHGVQPLSLQLGQSDHR